MNPVVSIIIPCYKVEKYIRRCIDSVIAQTYTDIEIILIDDGSPDNCGRICDEYSNMDQRIRVIHQDNKGLSGARNTGLDIAKGDYIFFLDSDDYIYPDTISLLYETALEKGADLVSSEYCKGINPNAFVDRGDGKVVSGNGAEVLGYVLENSSWSAWGKLYKCDLIGNNRFLEGFLYEDFEFVPSMYLKASSCAHVCRKLYFYYENEFGIMGDSKSCLKPYYVDFARKNLSLVNSSDYSEEEKERVKAGFYIHFSWDYTKPLKSFGLMQDKAFIDAYTIFINENLSDISHNKYLTIKYKFKYKLFCLFPNLFNSIYKLSYKIKKNM